MNRVFLFVCLFLSALVMLVISGAFGINGATRIGERFETQFKVSLETELSLLVRGLRNNLVLGNHRSVRHQLASLADSTVFKEYVVFKDETVLIKSENADSSGEWIRTEIPVYFDDKQSSLWGRVVFLTSRDQFLLLRQDLQKEALLTSALSTAGTFLLMLFLFVSLTRATSRISPVLEKLILDEELLAVSKMEQLFWGPALSKLQALVKMLQERRAEVEFERAQAVVARVIQHLVHDLRAPLGIFEKTVYRVSDWTEFLELRPQMIAALSRIHTMIDALRHSELDLLVQTEWSEFNLSTICEEARPFAEKMGVELSYSKCSAVKCLIDLPKVERAVSNLLRNAIECGAKSVDCTIDCQGPHLIIEISDNGPGVAEEIHDKLFSKGTTFGKEGGSGLGLAYVRSVALGHGGECTYLRVQERTILQITLPQCVRKNLNEKFSVAISPKLMFEELAIENLVLVLLNDTTKVENLRREADCTLRNVTFNVSDIHRTRIIYTDDISWIGYRESVQVVMAKPHDNNSEIIQKLSRRASNLRFS